MLEVVMTEQQPARLVTRMNRAIRDEITGLILNRRLKSGDPLPTETELVEALGVSRNSIREALKALQALDIVEIRHGYGTYVGRLSLDPLADGLTFRALHDIGRDLRSMEEIVEVREALEGALIRRVAATIPEADLAVLDEVTRRMHERATAGETFAEEDCEFHEVLYRSLDNALVTQLLRAFWDVFHRVNHRLGVTDPDPMQTVRRHRAIVTALRKRDVARAEAAMAEHFRNLDVRVAQLRST
ncbi:DNA-binding FadR family transcriptional regulator [Saccharothrix ecbatanensis]|jgi:DNA-binding FadR family transcriptional regulator|uniref:DNA-binding FadR family transcriptional regulator n=1 Tax=Saccharothrix ecbatanensis TaxID=1105145 RepID=A0A7W9LZT0_9PSEU|nr:FadR/GntR family transcriptional regulator [Saccharothrix ecbatanensis]MBB5802033.1 DNA-binding FadR family transcriptional regulator [Saccharothrix ecbatanensis]